MSRRLTLCLVLGLLIGAVPAAGAQNLDGSLVLYGSGAGRHSTLFMVPVTPSGQLEVSFHGDPSTGCLAQGLCGYSGTVIVRPGSAADILVSETRVHRHPSYQVQLDLIGGDLGAETAAHVVRAGGGVCGDVQQPTLPAIPGTVASGVASIPLLQPQGGLLATRCAGPLEGDVGRAGPQISLPVRTLLRGRVSLDLSGSRSFAAGGFVGTISSSLKLALGKPSRHASSIPKVFKTQRTREVSETLSVAQARGLTSLAVSGDPGTCQFLDSCGLRGSITGTIAPSHPQAELSVIGPAKRPFKDFLAALGLGGGGNPRGLGVFGSVSWDGGGAVATNLQQGTTCSSQGVLGAGAIELIGTARRLAATYRAVDPPHTRCPGAMLAETDALARGALVLRRAGGRRLNLRVRGSGSLGDDGYVINQRTALSLTLVRGQVHQTTF